VTIPVNPNPTCTVSGDTEVLVGTTNNYSSTISPAGGVVTHSWTVSGNGSILGPSDQPSVSVVANAPGSYTVTDSLTRDGCPGQCSLPVTVRGRPQICVTKEIACLLPGEVCGRFATIATGVKSETNCPAFCYRIIVRNCGDVDLVNLTVKDDLLDLSGCNFPTRLNAGAPALECIIEGIPLCENTTNTVTTTGQSVFDSSGSGFTQAQSSATGIVTQASIECARRVSSPDDQDGNPDDNHVSLPTDGQAHEVDVRLDHAGYHRASIQVDHRGVRPPGPDLPVGADRHEPAVLDRNGRGDPVRRVHGVDLAVDQGKGTRPGGLWRAGHRRPCLDQPADRHRRSGDRTGLE